MKFMVNDNSEPVVFLSMVQDKESIFLRARGTYSGSPTTKILARFADGKMVLYKNAELDGLSCDKDGRIVIG